MASNLQGQVIVITGGSSGIGAATARACAAAGMDVVVAARRVDRLQAVIADVEKLGRRGLAVACDVDRATDIQRLVEQTLVTFGRLDVAFANAGYGVVGPVCDTTEQQAHDIFETNFHGTLRLIRQVVPVMRKSGRGHILICSSSASEIGVPLYGVYAATKAAQDSIAGAMRAELADAHINVTSVHPIGTTSEFFDDLEQAGHEGVALNTPQWMMQTPEHVAKCIVRSIRRPRPEVWPNPWIRLAMALLTACPRLSAWAMRRHYRKGGMRES
jgi:short-subunit dehydrogenase